MRQVVLDTETTGLDSGDDRIIEIGCVELLNREPGREFHCVLNPERSITAGARKVHGRTDQDLADQPRFAEVADDLLRFVDRAEIIIHNAPFDLGFLNRELQHAGRKQDFEEHCAQIIDTLEMARLMLPGRRHSLDALCDLYQIDRTEREVHDALIDARLLARVYLCMTGGQTSMELAGRKTRQTAQASASVAGGKLKIIYASAQEKERHKQMLRKIQEHAADGASLWSKMEE